MFSAIFDPKITAKSSAKSALLASRTRCTRWRLPTRPPAPPFASKTAARARSRGRELLSDSEEGSLGELKINVAATMDVAATVGLAVLALATRLWEIAQPAAVR